MGPQPNSCGNDWTIIRTPSAGSELQWGHSQTAVETRRPFAAVLAERCFNGATAKQLWKLAGSGGARIQIPKLQWGHSQTAVET